MLNHSTNLMKYLVWKKLAGQWKVLLMV